MTAIEIEELVVRFGEETIIDHISFSVEEGQIFTVIGPNGAGKSVLLKTMLGIIPYTSGRISIGGKTVGEIHRDGPRIGYLPQRLDFEKTFPMAVTELMALAVKPSELWMPSAQTLRAIDEALERTGASGLKGKRIGELSGGELQRVLVAYAVAKDPEILLLDEPATGIDIAGEETFYNLIYQLHLQQKRTIVMVTHDLNVVYRYADSVVCLNRKMLCEGPPTVLTDDILRETYSGLSALYLHEHPQDR